MKFRVNLFPEELKPKLDLFTFNFVVTVWSCVIAAILGLNIYYQNQYSDAQMRTKATQQEYKTKTNLHQTLQQARDERKQDTKLLELVQQLRKEERDKYLLLTELQGRERLKNQGFSLLMTDLSEHHVDSVWLTRISVNEKKVRMEGASLDSAQVPVWVSMLKESAYFAGRSFAGARMYRDESDQLNFIISSEIEELAAPATLDVATELQ